MSFGQDDNATFPMPERDSLALEWELHQVRWLAQELIGAAKVFVRAHMFEPPPAKERLEYGESSREDLIAENERVLRDAPAWLERHIEAHAAERDWWARNKQTAPINELRRAVRAKMAGLTVALPEGDLPDDAPERVERRTRRWVLNIRAEIARRRMVCGQAALIVQETSRERAARDLKVLAELERPGDYDYDAHQRLMRMDDEAFAEMVVRRERAAAAYGVTGSQLAPGWLSGP